jgi:hypothetical protein
MKNICVGLAVALVAAGAGCEIRPSDGTGRSVSINVAGRYVGQLDGRVTSRNTGAPVTSLNVTQTGAALQAVDNNGLVFRGKISGETDSSAPFTLEGSTTAGAAVTISGTITVSGSSGTMHGTWIEPTLLGDVMAQATVATNAPSDSLTVSPAGPVNLAVGSTQTFTASGGEGAYTWSLGNTALGTMDTTSGSGVSYTATAAGSQTVQVDDGESSKTVSVIQL